MLVTNWWYARRENEMEIIVPAVLGIVFVAVGFGLGMAWKSDTVGQLKHENERLNSELKRLTDRDSRGRFKGGK